MKKLLVLLATVLIVSGSVFAAVTFKIGPSYNLFSDSRISGLNTSFGFLYDLEKLNVGYKIEQGNLTITDDQNSANNFRLSTQINAIEISKNVAESAGLPVSVGLELGSVLTTGLAGTVGAPAAISQVSPLVGIYGGIAYESAGKQVTTSINASIGYRFIDIIDTAIPAGFTAGGANFKDLNSVIVNLGLAIKF